METMSQFDEMKSSALRELANVGISHVATAVGNITKEKIEISLPQLQPFFKAQLLKEGANNGGMVAAYFVVEGISDLTETLLFLPKKTALQLMAKFVNSGTENIINPESLSLEEQKSIFMEICSLISSTYFSAVDSLFNLNTQCGIPQTSFGSDDVRDFMRTVLRRDLAIRITASFMSDESKMAADFVLIPDPETLDVFFRRIGL